MTWGPTGDGDNSWYEKTECTGCTRRLVEGHFKVRRCRTLQRLRESGRERGRESGREGTMGETARGGGEESACKERRERGSKRPWKRSRKEEERQRKRGRVRSKAWWSRFQKGSWGWGFGVSRQPAHRLTLPTQAADTLTAQAEEMKAKLASTPSPAEKAEVRRALSRASRWSLGNVLLGEESERESVGGSEGLRDRSA
eukprot:1672518-Rhodomonas_salina.2